MLGSIKMPLTGNKYYVVTGGPYREKPLGYTGVKMAAEIAERCTVDIPTRDYSVPETAVLDAGLVTAVCLMTTGQPLYVGCWGGKGRTGLFLAVLAKACGVKNPVEYVRSEYYAHAVETKAQEAWVAAYEVPKAVTQMLKKERRWSYLFFWRSNLTDLPGQVIHPPVTSHGLWRAE